MKKLMCLVLVCTFLFSLCACGKDNQSDTEVEADIIVTDDNSEVENNVPIENDDIGYKVGDYITFGSYEQDNDLLNGKEDIEWLVLDKQDNKVLVISKYALDCKPYNTLYMDVTWETCFLRKWLNNDFINNGFSADEKAMIPTVTISADENQEFNTNPGNATQEQVFLLSITEVNNYFGSDSARQCEPTDYAVANGAYERDDGNCYWWLRSPGFYQTSAAGIYVDGFAYTYGTNITNDCYAVRPAMWIDVGEIDNERIF